jgi:archaemetzincin
MILLVPLEFPSAEELGRLRRLLADRFATLVQISSLSLEPQAFHDPKRRQSSSAAILEALTRERPAYAAKVLAVTRLDLFIPILTFVFGEAQLSGPCAVVSSFRLDNTYYGLPPDRGLMSERLFKEAVHELGHTCGLIHCRHPECVMHTSTYVEEIDLKSSDFCPSCKPTLTGESKP